MKFFTEEVNKYNCKLYIKPFIYVNAINLVTLRIFGLTRDEFSIKGFYPNVDYAQE